MKKQDYTATIVVTASAEKAFECINRVDAWWTENVDGNCKNLDDVFTVTFGETFVTFKIVEAVAPKKMVWLVTDCYLHWLNDKEDWKGTKISFEILAEGDKTRIVFTHIGLVPEIECYGACVKGWDQYIKESLFSLITNGKGMPERKKLATATALS